MAITYYAQVVIENISQTDNTNNTDQSVQVYPVGVKIGGVYRQSRPYKTKIKKIFCINLT